MRKNFIDTLQNYEKEGILKLAELTVPHPNLHNVIWKKYGIFQGQCKSSLELKIFNDLFLKIHFYAKAVHLEIILEAKG